MTIDTKMLQEIQSKVQQIISLPYSGMYKEIKGMIFDEAGLTVNTEEYFRGEWEYTTDYIGYDDLVQPIELWADKFKKEADLKRQREAKKAEQQKEAEEKRDYEMYLSLKSKFENK